jgi:DeoR family fructose operon transcriptional repressor
MEYTGASESTIRRDLGVLDKDNRLSRVRGGAISLKPNTRDEKVDNRRKLHAEDKLSIAKYAASLIEDDDFVYLDSGTTIELMIEHIKAGNAVFVTNSISNLVNLTRRGFKAYILGGEYKESTDAVVGEEAIASVLKYNFTKGFFGTNGITKKNGFTTPEMKEALMKKAAMNNSKKVFVVADANKFGLISAVRFADFDKAHIITNHLGDDNYSLCTNVTEV